MGWISIIKDYIKGSEVHETLPQPDFGGDRKYMQPYSLTSPGEKLLDGVKEDRNPRDIRPRF